MQESDNQTCCQDNKKRNPLFQLGLSILLLIVSIIVLLLVTEGGLRVVGFDFELKTTVIEGAVPNLRRFYENYMIDRDLIWVSKDHYDLVKIMSDDNPEVLCIGDSCTQLGVYDKQLARLAHHNAPKRLVKIGKLGAAGWSSHQGLQAIKKELANLNPKVATIYFGWNDHWNSIGIVDEEVTRINSKWIFRFQPMRIFQLATKAYVGVRIRQQDSIPLRVPLKQFEKNLTEMIKLVRSNGTTCVLLTAPTSHEKGKEPAYLGGRWVSNLSDLVPMHEEYVNAVRRAAKENKVILCDLAGEFGKLPKEKLRNELFHKDGIHLTLEGNKMIADLLYKCFIDNKLFDKK